MEVRRNMPPKDNFLKKIRKFCTKEKIVLIFDECTSGFRETFGGLHLKYKVTPDICILGKALGNGYPITAILGKKILCKKLNPLSLAVLSGQKNWLCSCYCYIKRDEKKKVMEKNFTNWKKN